VVEGSAFFFSSFVVSVELLEAQAMEIGWSLSRWQGRRCRTAVAPLFFFFSPSVPCVPKIMDDRTQRLFFFFPFMSLLESE